VNTHKGVRFMRSRLLPCDYPRLLPRLLTWLLVSLSPVGGSVGVTAAPPAEQETPLVAILIDDSLSMGVVDQYADDKEVRKAVDHLARVASLKEPQRLQLAATLLTRQDPDWLDVLARQRKMG